MFKITQMAAAAVMLASTSVLATNGYFGHGYSTKEKGLAGAGVAYSQDSIASATNPAGILSAGNRFDIGVAVFNPNREYTVSEPAANVGFTLYPGNYASDNDVFLIPNIGASWMLDNVSAVGVAIYGNGGMDTEYNGVPYGTFGDGVTGVNLMQAFLNISYARQVDSYNTIGISAIGAVQSFRATGLNNFSQMSTDPANLTDNGRDYSTGAGVKVGWQGDVTKSFTLGASYQSKIWMSEFDDYAGLFADSGNFDIPATATIGLAWDTSAYTVLVFDVQQIYYGDVKALNNGIENITTGCMVGDMSQCLGGSNGAGFGWDDMTIYKVGYEFGRDTKWRVGASYGEQPIRDGQTMFNILAPAVVTTHLTAGFTTPVGKNQEISFSGMYAPSNEITAANPMNPSQNITLEMDQYEVQAGYSLLF